MADGVRRAPGEGEGVVEGARRRRLLLRPAGPIAGEELVFAIGLDRPSGDEAPAMKQIEMTFQKKNSIEMIKLPCKTHKSQMNSAVEKERERVHRRVRNRKKPWRLILDAEMRRENCEVGKSSAVMAGNRTLSRQNDLVVSINPN